MKPNLINENDRAEILSRLARLTPESQRQWGTMDLTIMLAHVGEQVRICLGDKPAPMKGNAIMRWLARQYGFRLTSLPKNMRTLRELHPTGGLMTPPTHLESDRATLLVLLDRLYHLPESQKVAHPVFGTISKKELGQLTYLHLDHHLKQFGV